MGFLVCLTCGLFRFGLLSFEIIVGYLFPLMKTLQLICKNPKEFSQEDLKKWLTYWLTLALLATFIFPIFSHFSGKFYFFLMIIKAVVMGFLVLSKNGTTLIYEKFFKDNQGIIDKILDKFQIYCKKAVEMLGIAKESEKKKE